MEGDFDLKYAVIYSQASYCSLAEGKNAVVSEISNMA